MVVLWLSPQTKPVQQNTRASSRSSVDCEETALQSWIKKTEESVEYFPLQGMNVVLILELDKQSGSLIIHTKIAPVRNTGKLRNKQFLLGLLLDYVVTIAFLYSVPSQNWKSFFFFFFNVFSSISL